MYLLPSRTFETNRESRPRCRPARTVVWVPSVALARAYLDQLARSNGLTTETIASARAALDTAERHSGAPRKTALAELATRLTGATDSARDSAKVRLLSTSLSDLANAQR